VSDRHGAARSPLGDDQVLAEWSIRGVMIATLSAVGLLGLLVLAAFLDRSSGAPTALGIVAVAVIGLTLLRAVRKLGRGRCTLTSSHVHATSAPNQQLLG